MKRIKVLEMIDRSFLGGGQTNLLALASSLDKSQFEVSVCSDGGGLLVEEIKKRGITHLSVPFKKRFRRRTITDIVAVLAEHDFDVLHTHGGVAGFFGRWAGRKCRVPVIIHTLHGLHYLHYRNVFLKGIYILLERLFSRFTDAVIFVCESDRNAASRFRLVPEGKGIVITNGVDLASFVTAQEASSKKENWEEELGVDLSFPVVGTIARLHRQKGILYLLKTAKRLSADKPGIRILIVGGGPMRKRLEAQSRNLGLGGVVHFLGERKEVRQLLSLFDIFVLSSLWEGLPYSVMEAAALGKPVVATDVDGVKELIADGRTGVLVPPKKPEMMAQAVLRLLEDKDRARQLGARLKQDIQERYSLSRMVEETQNLYLSLYRSYLKLD